MFLDPAEIDSPATPGADDVSREALRATYRVLDRLNAEDRMVFALRYIEGLELTQVASACDCSLATVKRRLTRASDRFQALAKREPALAPWIRKAAEDKEVHG
jgi:RNA polymerase sigma-70 factor (ECF subfamily)